MKIPQSTVIITGAGRGIGHALTRYFAKLEHVRVFALSRDPESLDRLVNECKAIRHASEIVPVEFDLENLLVQTERHITGLLRELTHVDILINNAGFLVNKPFDQVSPEDAMHLLNVNFLGPARLIRELLPFMGGAAPTHVVNIGSMGGFQGSVKYPGLAYYSASKAALANLTESLNAEYRSKNIRFNCLALGAVQTEMLHEAFPGYKAPLSAEEVAEFIGNFARQGHQYISGQVIPVSLSNP